MEKPMGTKHTPGPWRLEGDRIEADGKHNLPPVATVYRAKGHEAEDAANAALLATAPELLGELKLAQLVILAMLGFMNTEQKAHVAAALLAAGIAGKDANRYHERRALIKRATAAPKAPPRS
jgi:hypothetical protein